LPAVSGCRDTSSSIEKIASDGVTKIGVYRQGIFEVTLSGSCTVGDPLATQKGSHNHVKATTDALSGAKIMGYALETGTTGETILAELNISTLKGKQ